MTNTDKILEEFEKSFWLHRVPNHTKQMKDIKSFIATSIAQAIAEERERVVWVKYKDKKPVIGQLVIFYRDIESRQIIATKWTKEEENYAEMNEITHWMPIEYPDLLSSLDTPLPE